MLTVGLAELIMGATSPSLNKGASYGVASVGDGRESIIIFVALSNSLLGESVASDDANATANHKVGARNRLLIDIHVLCSC